jgi:hypothetical protein
MRVSSYETSQDFIASLSLGEDRRLPGALPNSSARYDLAVVVSRPVSIFLRVLTGFFLAGLSFFSKPFTFPPQIVARALLRAASTLVSPIKLSPTY